MSKIRRRLGKTPAQRGSLSGQTCPDIFELDDGRFAIIGTEMTEELRESLPADARLGTGRILVFTRETLLAAKRDIRDA